MYYNFANQLQMYDTCIAIHNFSIKAYNLYDAEIIIIMTVAITLSYGSLIISLVINKSPIGGCGVNYQVEGVNFDFRPGFYLKPCRGLFVKFSSNPRPLNKASNLLCQAIIQEKLLW